MKTIAELAEKWNGISPVSGGFLLISDDHPLNFHIGIQGNNEKVFVVINTGIVKGISSSKAVTVENILLDDGSYALRFSLNYPSLDEIFIKLCWDLMQSSNTEVNPVLNFIEQYRKWQILLQRVTEKILSVSAQKGLIGELLFLKERAEIEGIEDVLSAWVGPEGADQDFDFHSFWAEVKTTAIAGNVVIISSLQQMDRSDDGFLIVYRMDKTTSNSHNSISLDSAITAVEELLESDKQRNAFAVKLARVGFQNKDRDKYKDFRFRLDSREIFAVAQSFPRLTKANIPSEVTEAKYGISLAAIEPFKIQEI